MRHLTTAEKSFIIGDEVARLVMQYAALLARVGGGDTVDIAAFGADGDEVLVTLLLNSGTVMASESVHSTRSEPENGAAEQYLRERLASYTDRPQTFPSSDDDGEG